jgi:hypothetical protein
MEEKEYILFPLRIIHSFNNCLLELPLCAVIVLGKNVERTGQNLSSQRTDIH